MDAASESLSDTPVSGDLFLRFLDDYFDPLLASYRHRTDALEQRLATAEASKSGACEYFGFFTFNHDVIVWVVIGAARVLRDDPFQIARACQLEEPDAGFMHVAD